MQKKYESGRSLVEMVGVLALMGLITAAAFVLIQAGSGSQKRSRATDEIDIIASNVRAMVAQAIDTDTPFSSLPKGTVCAEKLNTDGNNLAKALLKSKTGATPFDKSSSYSVFSTDGGTTFSIELRGIGADECQSMGTRQYANGKGQCCSSDGTTALITFTE